jgi:iron complex transport system substrate-binding protein
LFVVAQVGEAAGVREEALHTVDNLRTRLRRTAGEVAAVAAAAPSRPRVLVLQSLRPLRTAGWWLPDQLTLAGGCCCLEEQAGDASVELTWEQVQALAPEILVVAGMQGGSVQRPLTDLCAVASLPGWWLLPAVKAGAIYVADAALFCRAGPRLVEGVECLARMLWGEDAMPNCSCPERAVLKLSLRPGQRCRPRLLPNHFVPFA